MHFVIRRAAFASLGLALCLPAALVVATVPVIQDEPQGQEKPEEGQEQKPVKQPPVDHRKLKEWLPAELGGLKRTGANSSRTKMGEMTMVTADASYGEGEQTISVNVQDHGGQPEVLGMLAIWQNMEIDNETDTGYEKTTTIEGFPAMEKHDTEGNYGEVTVLVADRFIVTVQSNGLEKDAFQKMHANLNLKKLAEVAKSATSKPAGEGAPKE